MADLDKKQLGHLAQLARLELNAGEETKYLNDLKKILDHFQELQAVNTDEVMPMTGGTELKSIFRPDEINENRLRPDTSVEQFPEREKNLLKVPPVFE